MLKKYWLLLTVALVTVLVLGYLGRHKIKAMLGMVAVTPAPVATTSTTTSTTSNIFTTKTDAKKGAYLADFAGMTLYTYSKDKSGTSSCYTTCATNWPPYISGTAAQGTLPQNFTVVTRTEGTKQFAYKGMPLYYYAKDKVPGDMTGDGVGGIWHFVKP